MSVTGPIRMQIGPAKKHVRNHIDSAKAQLQQNIPTDITPLAEYLEKLRIEHEGLSTVSDKLRLKHDTWENMLTELKDQDELNHYEASCEEIMDLLHDSDDLRSQLGARVKTAELALNTGLSSAGQPQAGTSASSAPLVPPVSVPPIQVQAQPQHSSAFKAPKIKLPTFDGDYMEFKQFWGIFESSIHNRTDMTNTEKFTYLLSQLEGDAKRSIARLMVNDDNYDVAVAIVKTRYDRADERIVTMLYSEFHRLPSCGSKTAEKQRTLDECEQIFRGLEAAGENINSNKSMVFNLLSKFSVGMVKDLQRYHNMGANNTLNEVREALRKFIVDEEATEGVISDIQSAKPNSSGNNKHSNSDQGQDTPSPNSYEHGKSFTFQNSALSAVVNNKRQWQGTNEAAKFWNPITKRMQYLVPPCSCYFCGGDHFNGDCDRYTSAKDRQKRLTEVNRCVRCLKTSDHAVGSCPVPIKCIYCRSTNDHASALCFSKYPDVSTVSISQIAPSALPPKSRETDSSDDPLKNIGSGGATVLNRDVKPSLFQTAKTTAINSATGEQCTVRIGMDTMSSRSYIRQAVSLKLGLKDEHADKLSVSVFGTTKTLEVPTSLVEFEVVLRDGTRYKIIANTTGVICQAGAFPDDWSNEEKTTLNAFKPYLADDPFDTNDTIDVLLGANEVWNFIDGPRQLTLCPTLFLIPSKFGLMLSGESQCGTEHSKSAMPCITEYPSRFPSELGLGSCDSKVNQGYLELPHSSRLQDVAVTTNTVHYLPTHSGAKDIHGQTTRQSPTLELSSNADDDLDTGVQAIRPGDFISMRPTDSQQCSEVKPEDFHDTESQLIPIRKQLRRNRIKLWRQRIPRGQQKQTLIAGQLRLAELKLANRSTLRRPLNDLFPPEVERSTETSTNDEVGYTADPAARSPKRYTPSPSDDFRKRQRGLLRLLQAGSPANDRSAQSLQPQRSRFCRDQRIGLSSA